MRRLNDLKNGSLPNMDSSKFFEMSLDLLAIIGMDGYFKLLSPSWEKTLGWSLQTLLSQPCLDFVHPDDHETTIKEAILLREGNDLVRYVNRYRCENSDYRWLRWKATAEGEHCYCVAQDVTNELQQERLLHQISDLSKSGGWIFEVTNNQVFGSEQIYKIFELPPSTPLDIQRILNFFPQPFYTYLASAFHDALHYGRAYDMELQMLSAKGNTLWLRLIGNPETRNGKTVKIIGSCQDITERKLERIQAIHASKMAALGEMAGGIAHEINNPLGVISLRAQHIRDLLISGPQNIDKTLQLVSVIEETCERIATIIKGLRTFARGEEADPFEETNLEVLLEDTLNVCRERFDSAKVTLSVFPPAEPINISCNRVQISQVLLNLLCNALHAAMENVDQRWVRIEFQNSPSSIRILISDSGYGIPKHIRSHIMEPFFTTKKVGEGSGLGLSISKSIIEEHQGRLYLDEEQPHTCFVMELQKIQLQSVS